MATLPNKRIRKRIYWCHRHAMDVLQNLTDHVTSCLEPEEVLSEKCYLLSSPIPKERFSRTWISRPTYQPSLAPILSKCAAVECPINKDTANHIGWLRDAYHLPGKTKTGSRTAN